MKRLTAVLLLVLSACSAEPPTAPVSEGIKGFPPQGVEEGSVSAQSVSCNVKITHPHPNFPTDMNKFRYQGALFRSRGDIQPRRWWYAYTNVYGQGVYWNHTADSFDLVGIYPYCAYPSSCTNWWLHIYVETIDGLTQECIMDKTIGQGAIAHP